MSVKFFGQFLIEKGIITVAQLLEAVEYQASKNMRFGIYALSKNYLKDIDIRKLNDEQKLTDMKMGELAVQLGMMTQAQVEELLTMQRNDHMFIGEALVRKGFMDHDTLVRELALFREDQKFYFPDKIRVPREVRNPQAIAAMVDITSKMLRRVAGVDVKVGEGFISEWETETNYSVTTIGFKGAYGGRYILSSSREPAVRIASGVMGEDAGGEPDEVIFDGIREFCNIVCGSVISFLAKRGLNVEITPPEMGFTLDHPEKAVMFPLISTAGDLSLIVVDRGGMNRATAPAMR